MSRSRVIRKDEIRDILPFYKRKIGQDEFEEVLRLHKLWLRKEEGGKPADLRWAELSGIDLRGAFLVRFGLSAANLRGADLRRADLRGAILISTDLSATDLRGARLSRQHLTATDLRGADLRVADLRAADLRDSKWDAKTRLDHAYLDFAILPRGFPRPAPPIAAPKGKTKGIPVPPHPASHFQTHFSTSYTNLIGLLSGKRGEEAVEKTKEHLAALRAFVRFKTLSGAAIPLCCNRQTVKNHIVDLSESLCAELMQTVGKKTEPTDAGKALTEWTDLLPHSYLPSIIA